jgi:hypothetical protein
VTPWATGAKLPPVGDIGPGRPLSGVARAAFDGWVAAALRDGQVQQRLKWAGGTGFDPAVADAAWEELARRELDRRLPPPLLALCDPGGAPVAAEAFRSFLRTPELELVHLLRACALVSDGFRFADCARDVLVQLLAEWVLPELDRRGCPLGLRELALAAAACGMPAEALALARFDITWGDCFAFELDRLWPYYAENPEALGRVLGVAGSRVVDFPPASAVGRRIAALEILGLLPPPPGEWLERIAELAFESPQDDRHAARLYLAERGPVQARVDAALAAGRPAARRGAAEWLGRGPGLDPTVAVEALRTAWDCERDGGVRAAIAAALERRGAPLGVALTRDELVARASGARLPATLLGLRLDEGLPVLAWADASGAAAPPEVAIWMIATAAAGRDPRPSPELRAAVATLAAGSRGDLAFAVLHAWRAGDTTGDSRLLGLAGLLAAAGDARLVPAVVAAIRADASRLTVRSRALVRMLTAVDDPVALRALLGLRATMRTASVRKEAEEALAFLADRRGWNAADLEDAAVPDLGFAADGTCTLGDGSVVELGADLRLRPLARAAANDGLAKLEREVAKAWAAQVRRFEEAMVAGRSWDVRDWREALWAHPLLRLVCRRTLWQPCDEEGARGRSFRLRDDGSAVDATGNRVRLPERERLVLAHRLFLSHDEVTGWERQLAAGELLPAFPQLRAAHRPAPAELGARLHEVPPLAWAEVPRRAAQRLAAERGFVKGPGYDNGRLFRYLKTFPSAGLTAWLEVCDTGSEEQPTLQPRGFCFSRAGARSATAQGFDVPRLRFSQVPPVLWSETREDLRELIDLAAEH